MSEKRFPNDHLLVSTQWLVDHLNDPEVRLVEVSAPGGGYMFGHPPGAVYLNLDQVLTGDDNSAPHMVGPLAEVAATLGRLGLTPDKQIVIYDEIGGTRAAKAFWLLEYLGFPQVHVLEGGDRALDGGKPAPNPHQTEYRTGHLQPDPASRPAGHGGMDRCPPGGRRRAYCRLSRPR